MDCIVQGVAKSLTRLSDIHFHAAAKSLQSCPTLCDPIEGSPLGSSIHGIFQARVLEWGAIALSNTGPNLGQLIQFLHLLLWCF